MVFYNKSGLIKDDIIVVKKIIDEFEKNKEKYNI